MAEDSINEVCGYDCRKRVIGAGFLVKVDTTDPGHEGDDKFKFCWAGKSGRAIRPGDWPKHTFVRFGIPGEGVEEINLLSGFLKIIKEKEQDP